MNPAAADEATPSRHGRIITFYSYKGGTGRSMALANIGWILAANGKRVLMIDWDLEAPGLHRYFAPFLVDKDLTASDGVIDFLTGYAVEAVTPLSKESAPGDDWYDAHAAKILDHAISIEWAFPDGGVLDLLPAGRQGTTYATRVTSFNWQNFYDRLGGHGFLEAAKSKMRVEYDFILVDSRTGVSDTAGICTVQLPDALVVCLTLNNQSIEGAAAVASSVSRQRADPGFDVFPIPMRVENSEKDKLALRWDRAKQRFAMWPGAIGDGGARDQYWQDVAVPYLPYYAYEELLAPFGNARGDPPNLNLLLCMERLAQRICGVDAPIAPLSDNLRGQILNHYRTGHGDLSPAAIQRKEIEERQRAEVLRQAEEEARRRREETLVASAQAEVSQQYEERAVARSRVTRRRMLMGALLAVLVVLGGSGLWYWQAQQEALRAAQQEALRAAQEEARTAQEEARAAQQAARAARIQSLIISGGQAALSEDFQTALSAYTDALVLSPGDPSLLVRRGRVYRQLSETTLAIKDFGEAIERASGEPEAYFERGRTYLLTKDYAAARRDFERVTQIDPKNTEAYLQRAIALDNAENTVAAIEAYTAVLARAPKKVDALFNRGMAYSRTGQRRLAINDLQRVAEIAPASSEAVAATSQLMRLGVSEPPAPSSRLPSVALQHADPRDASLVGDVAKKLEASKQFTVSAPQPLSEPTLGSVRYFVEADADAADTARSLVQAELTGLGVPIALDLRRVNPKELRGKQPSARIEVWLPSLSRPLSRPLPPSF